MSQPLPFEISLKDGVLHMTMDTPGSAVNIFNHHAALQVAETMTALRPGDVRAVVFRSNKPFSFINGVGLLLANAVQSAEDAIRLTEGTRRAYESVRNAPVPTIAVVEGNCYGCGVEFILNCSHRVAADSFDTHFYMTEINDYLFIPAFGGTQHLPPLVGLKKAIDLVLWGERWTARTAKRHGLIQGVFDPAKGNEALASVLAGLDGRKGKSAARSRARASGGRVVVGRAERRIAQLPPAYQEVYRDCLSLMEKASHKDRLTAGDYRAELTKSAKSVMADASKRALSFFFIRQGAQGVSLRGEEIPALKWHLGFPAIGSTLGKLRKDLEARRPRGATVESVVHGGIAGGTFAFVPQEGDGAGQGIAVGAVLTVAARQASVETDAVLYNPAYGTGPSFFEVAVTGMTTPGTRALFRYLNQAGFSFVYSNRDDRGFVLNRWLGAYFAPLVAYCLDGGKPGRVNAAMRDMGFVRRPGSLLDALVGKEGDIAMMLTPFLGETTTTREITAALKALRAPKFEGGKKDPLVCDALCLSLLAEAKRGLVKGELKHPMHADLIGRDVLDFPLRYRSCLSYMTRERVREMLGRYDRASGLVMDSALAVAESYAGEARDFYL